MKQLLLSTVAAACLALPATGYSANKNHGQRHGGGGGRAQAQRNFSRPQQAQRNFGRSNQIQRSYRGSPGRYATQRSYSSQRNYSSRSNIFARHSRHWNNNNHHWKNRHRDHRSYRYTNNYYRYNNRGYYSNYGYYGRPYYGYGYGYGYPYNNLSVSYYSQPGYAYRGYEVDDGDSLAADVQRALQRKGYYRGYVDGEIGAGSRSAIRAYQADRGLPITGRIDSRLLDSLGLD